MQLLHFDLSVEPIAARGIPRSEQADVQMAWEKLDRPSWAVHISLKLLVQYSG